MMIRLITLFLTFFASVTRDVFRWSPDVNDETTSSVSHNEEPCVCVVVDESGNSSETSVDVKFL